MSLRPARRHVLAAAAALAGGSLAHPTVRNYLDLLAPGSGAAWDALEPPPRGSVSSPYGTASVRYDDDGVPFIEADDELALQYAHGYVQGADRLFQLDLFRRQMRGELSAVVGSVALDSDEFHARMGFDEAAGASRTAIAGTEVEAPLEAFVDGVNAARERVARPLETALLEYRIEPWTATDSLLIEKLIGWQLTGRFRTLRRAAFADAFDRGLADDLYPAHLEHDATIIRSARADPPARAAHAARPPAAAVRWLSRFEQPPGIGSNSWIIGPAHTDSGHAIVANDPHLSMMAPPIWYEVALETPSFASRGMTFPGVPFVVIGRNRAGAWGFTNVPADVMDFYAYEVDGDEYRHGDGWRAFETHERTIAVADGDDRTVTIRRTVHGPMIDRHGAEVAVAWTGLGASRTIRAIRAFQDADGLDAFEAALEWWDVPPQNVVYADRDDRTLYRVTGKVPLRRVDGEAVRGDRVFDGSAREAEWGGFEPYGEPTWSEFLQGDDLPHAVDPDLLATANQRPVNDHPHYFAEVHAPPFRARRIWDRLEAAVADGAVDRTTAQAVQLDVRDELAAMLVPEVIETVEPTTDEERAARDALAAWSFEMRSASRAAVVFAFYVDALRERLFDEALAAADLDEAFRPSDWVLATLPADHRWFDRAGDRASGVQAAFEAAVEAAADYESYGAYHRADIDHPLGLDFLGYRGPPAPGSGHTVRNFSMEAGHGSGLRLVAEPAADAADGRLAGGNAGRYGSPHYDDQLADWVAGTYKALDWTPTAITRRLSFGGGSA